MADLFLGDAASRPLFGLWFVPQVKPKCSKTEKNIYFL